MFVKNPVYGNPDNFDYMPPIRKAEARGNSREVDQNEYDHLAASGKVMLDQRRQNEQSTEGLRQNWNDTLNQAFAAVQKPWGGVTINPATGRDIKLASGRDVGPFAMSVKDEGQNTISIPIDSTQQRFNAAMLQARHAFPQISGQDHYLGVFRDDAKGTIDIDPVLVVDTPREVERIGAYTHASGGAYDYATGDGYFPPHLDYMPKTKTEVPKFQEEMKQMFPEALQPTFKRNKQGQYIKNPETGELVPELRPWNLDQTPLYKSVNNGMSGEKQSGALMKQEDGTFRTSSQKEMDARYVKALADKISQEYQNNWSQDPRAMQAKGWYTDLYNMIEQKMGKDNAELFAQLLSTTSPGNFASNNFKFALDAYNNYISGRYDDILTKFKKSYDAWQKGELKDASGNSIPSDTKGLFNKYLRDNGIIALQESGKKLGKHSLATTYTLAGQFWKSEKGLKVAQFVKNISGIDVQNPTIDLWAARAADRLSNQGNTQPWRDLPMNEGGINDRDFLLAQQAFKKAAEQLDLNATDLQAIAWFAEKINYGKNGWIRGGPGAELGDFRPFLRHATPREGRLNELQVPKGLKLSRAPITRINAP